LQSSLGSGSVGFYLSVRIFRVFRGDPVGNRIEKDAPWSGHGFAAACETVTASIRRCHICLISPVAVGPPARETADYRAGIDGDGKFWTPGGEPGDAVKLAISLPLKSGGADVVNKPA